MSFEIYAQRFVHGDVAPADKQAVIAVVRPYLVGDRLQSADGSTATLLGLDDEPFTGLGFGRPERGEVFELIFQSAKQADLVLVWPSEPLIFAITHPEQNEHLPAGDKQVRLVTSGKDLLELLEA